MPMECWRAAREPQTLVRAGMIPEAVRVAVRNALWSLPVRVLTITRVPGRPRIPGPWWSHACLKAEALLRRQQDLRKIG